MVCPFPEDLHLLVLLGFLGLTCTAIDVPLRHLMEIAADPLLDVPGQPLLQEQPAPSPSQLLLGSTETIPKPLGWFRKPRIKASLFESVSGCVTAYDVIYSRILTGGGRVQVLSVPVTATAFFSPYPIPLFLPYPLLLLLFFSTGDVQDSVSCSLVLIQISRHLIQA